MLVALGVGFAAGYAFYQPRVASLEGSGQERAASIAALEGRLQERDARVETLLEDLGELRVQRSTLEATLRGAEADLSDTRAALEEAQTALRDALAESSERGLALASAQRQVEELEEETERLVAAQEGIGVALGLQADILTIVSSRVNTNLGDGSLLAMQGATAASNQTYATAAAYFEEAGGAFGRARAGAEEAASNGKALFLTVPKDIRLPFSVTHKQTEAAARAAGARELEYEAAAALYRTIAEWDETGEGAGEDDLARWSAAANEAEALVDEALALLDDASDWSPDMWRQFDAIRLEIREWQDLLQGVRSVVLGE